MFKPLSNEYVDPSAYSWLFSENIGQHRTSRQVVYHLTLQEYKMFGYMEADVDTFA